MFKAKTEFGHNIIGEKIKYYRLNKMFSVDRKKKGISQRELADLLTKAGCPVHKNAIQRIESGQGFVTDIEVYYFCKVFNVSPNDLFENSSGTLNSFTFSKKENQTNNEVYY